MAPKKLLWVRILSILPKLGERNIASFENKFSGIRDKDKSYRHTEQGFKNKINVHTIWLNTKRNKESEKKNKLKTILNIVHIESKNKSIPSSNKQATAERMQMKIGVKIYASFTVPDNT